MRFVLALLPAVAFAACDGVAVPAAADPQAVIASHAAGTTYCFAPGLYRLTETLVPKDGDRLIGSPGTVLNGSKLVTGWTRQGNLWIATGQAQRSEPLWKATWPALAHPAAQVNEDLFLDDRQLRPVMSAAEVASGTFYFDYGAATIYLGEDPRGHRLESSVLDAGIRSRARNVTVRGLTLEKFTHLGIGLGSDAVVEANEVRYVHGAGIQFGDGSRILRNRTHHNGMYGMSGAGEGPLVEGNEIAFNNTAGYHTEHGGCWAAGGAKFVRSNHMVVRGNFVHDNYCAGLWSDIDNINTTYENNRILNNYAQGLFIEISYAGVIRNNTITGNMGTGIMINSSSDQDIYGNTIGANGVGTPDNGVAVHPSNRGDIVIIQQRRGSGDHGERLSKNLFIHDNTITIRGGVTGATRQQGNAAVFAQNNRFESNRYLVADPAGKWWVWEKGPCDWAEWQAAGQDRKGTAAGLK